MSKKTDGRGRWSRPHWIDRFWAKVQKSEECWEWTSAICDGYGVLWMGRSNSAARAHRLSWEIHNGPIPEGLLVCHACDNRKCVRPSHLFLGTDKDNNQDMIQKGRWRGGPLKPSERKGSEINFAKLNEEKVFRIKRMILKGVPNFRIADWLFLSRGAIGLIKNGKNWKHVPNPRSAFDTFEMASAA